MKKGSGFFLKHILKNLKMLFPLLGDKNVPFYIKLLPILAVIYFIFPLDIFPDFLVPVVGYGDDVVIAVFLFDLFFKLIPDEIKNKYVGKEKEDDNVEIIDVTPEDKDKK